jgi:hydroxymethylbilane synthase
VLAYLPEGARLGTQDARQASQLRRRRTDLDVVEVGDDAVDALARLEQPDVEGVVIRACDLAWLGQLDRVAEYFDTDQMIPAPGQAVPILEVRDGDAASTGVLAPLHDASTAYAWRAERACADRLGAHHASPVGVFAVTDGEDMFVHGIVATPDGSRAARLRWSGPNREAAEVGDTLAELLESIGAAEILAGGPLPPSIRYAERRRRLVEDLDRDLDHGLDLGPRLDIDLDQDLDDDRVRRN